MTLKKYSTPSVQKNWMFKDFLDELVEERNDSNTPVLLQEIS